MPTTSDEPGAWVDLASDVAATLECLDAFEARADERIERTLVMKGKVLVASRSVTAAGLGITVYAGRGMAHVYTTAPTRESVREEIERGIRLARAAGLSAWSQVLPDIGPARRVSYRPTLRDPPATATNEAIADLLRRANEGAKAADPRAEPEAAYGCRTTRTFLSSSAGSRVELESLVSTLRVLCTLREDGRSAVGSARLAGERGLEDAAADGVAEGIGAQAARHARESFRAAPLASGRYRVLCDNELSGTLAHESFGHLTEHDLVASGWSTLQGSLGRELAGANVSVSDAPVSPADPREGVAVPYDDQGTKGRKVTMLENGVLRSWMHTRDSARDTDAVAGGNGRALDARFPAIVRMRNTFFEPGDATFDEALEAVGDGLYLIGARGGAPYCDGSFMFTAIRGYRVEGGKLAEPVRTTAIHGNIFDFLRNVETVTRDFRMHTNFFGGCGKRDQSFLHVGVGGPQVLVRDALVGGI